MKILRCTLLCTMLFAHCYSYANTTNLSNFNDPNTTQLIQAIQQNNIHIVQLGDSHTAGDSMTHALRSRLQQQLGDGGMGWAMPMYFNGQRMSKFGYDNHSWQAISSRTNRTENYTLGGLIAKPLQHGASLTLKAKQNEPAQEIIVSIRQSANDGRFVATDATGQQVSIVAPLKNNTWQTARFTATLPVTIRAEHTQNSAIGGWWAYNSQQKGAIVSALGINGAELSHWNRWNQQAWQQELSEIRPQLIILAYGTNEAYNNVNAQHVGSVLTQRIQQIRQASPHSAIMIMSAPESLKSIHGACGTRPAQLSAIQQVQRQVAQNEHTLFWDWQNAMGGECSMTRWIQQGKASRDGVHFTQKGYQQLGNSLANDLLHFANTGTTTPQPQMAQHHQFTPVPIAPAQQGQPITIPSTLNNTGSAKICFQDEKGKEICQHTINNR